MKYIPRERLLAKLIHFRGKDLVKIITGIRRCGKSVMLNELFYNYLLKDGVSPDYIITILRLMKKSCTYSEILSRGTTPAVQTEEGLFPGESVPGNEKLSEIFLQLRTRSDPEEKLKVRRGQNHGHGPGCAAPASVQ